MKIYLAHTISTTGEFNDSIRVAKKLEDLGHKVYAPALNKSINDKSNNPTPSEIYKADIDKIKESDLMIVNVTGGNQDGTISEIGFVAGWNEKAQSEIETINIIGYTSNKRVLQPQHHLGIPSASINHLVLGMIERHGEFVGTEEYMLEMIRDDD